MTITSIYRHCAVFTISFFTVSLLFTSTVTAQETEDAKMFLSGFNTYQQKNYPKAADQLTNLLQKHPGTPMRDMALFWLARSHYNAGNKQEAARYMAQFSKEYPDSPLRNTAEDELLELASKHNLTADKSTVTAKKQQPDTIATKQLADEKAKAEQLAKQMAEAERLAAAKKEEEARQIAAAEAKRAAEEKARAEQIAKQKEEAERLAAAKKEEEQLKAKAEAKRIAEEKAKAEQLAKQRAEAERLAAAKKEEEARQIAATEAKRAADEKARAEQIAKQKEEAERLAAVKKEEEARQIADAEAKRVAEEKAKAEQLAKQKAEAERLAAVKKEEEARLKAAAEAKRLAEEKAKAEQLAKQKAAEEKAKTEQIAKQKEEERQKLAQQQQQGFKDKAIAEYKGIIERFPNTPAAQSAAERLKELGVAVALPATTITEPASPVEISNNTQVFTLEVAQYAAFELSAQSPQSTIPVGQNFQVPFVLQNLGNGIDSFYLVSDFPPEFNARFVSTSAPDKNINQTPALSPGERFTGILQLNMPVGYIDGFRLTHPIKAASSFMPEASQSRVVSAVASAPLLRAVIKTEKSYISPQEVVPYNITVMNVGSAIADDVTLKVNFPPQYIPAENANNNYRQEMGAALVLDGINLKPGESRSFTANFQLKASALANEELIVRADLLNNQLELNAAFVSNAVFVRPISNLGIKLATNTLQAVPGQVLTLPVRLINKGNQREKINLSASGTALQQIRIFQDLNRDGLLQHGEPEISTVGPLGSKEEVVLLLEITTLKNALDGSNARLTLNATPETGMGDAIVASAAVNYSRPQLQLAMKGRQGKMTPGELITVDFEVLNSGSSLAKMAQLEVTWPHQLELVTTDQTASSSSAGTSTWNLEELGAGEKKLIKASFRIKSGTGVGTGLQLKSVLSYQDLMGNRY